jgi:FKBP-type peptidyl-prolyl cis-trans isomerase FkpA
MKKLIFALVCIAAAGYFLACNKSTPGYTACGGNTPAQDSTALLQYADDSIHVTRDTSGMYFQIIDTGSGVSPTGTSGLTVTYVARLMNNSIFDSTSNSNLGGLLLDQLIAGWQIGLPKIKKGGHIKLLIPSALAWSCQGSGTAVPPNSPVYFDIHLINVQ